MGQPGSQMPEQIGGIIHSPSKKPLGRQSIRSDVSGMSSFCLFFCNESTDLFLPLNWLQAMKISPLDHKRLDEELAKNLVAQRVPGHLFQMSKADETCERVSAEEFPTVLHFAARFGLLELMWLLLECPGATEALKIPNADGHDVVALANLHGHTEIVSNLQSMQEVVRSI